MAGDIQAVDTALSSGLLRTAPRREGNEPSPLTPLQREQKPQDETLVKRPSDSQQESEGLAKLQQMAEQLNQNPLIANQLMFEVRPEERLSIIKIVDVKTHETVRQIPSEEALARLEQIQRYLEQVKQRIQAETAAGGGVSSTARELLTGVLLNQRV